MHTSQGLAQATRLMAQVALLLGLALLLVGAVAAEASPQAEVHFLEVQGVINPLTAQYLSRGLSEAQEAEAQAVVVRLNTPGGLESSTRDMAEKILASPVPVIVYVAPSGAHAASAGMFITVAAHVAAMAPGTNIGAAHPVGLGGEIDPVMEEKIVQDAAALARSLAERHGRNVEWVERAVRESVSITASEALALNVVDVVAADRDELLRAIDGRQVTTTVGDVTLQTADAPVAEKPMTLPEQILHVITDPNIAYILLTIGTIGIIAELYNPGAFFPGITGALSLILAFVAVGSLPLNWAGLFLLFLAFGLFLAELYTDGIGFLAVGGVAAFVLGSLMLFTPITPTSPIMPDVQVSPWLVAAMTAGIVAFFLVVLRGLWTARSAPVAVGAETMLGHTGVATSRLSPAGTVQVDSEVWTATLEGDGSVELGEEVEVVGVEGVTLRVRRR